MRDVPASISSTWLNGTFIGERRPIARVTVQHPKMKLWNYSLLSAFKTIVSKITAKNTSVTTTFDLHAHTKISQTYADYLFSSGGIPLELPNVKSLSWQRSIDSDVADCTIECWNTAPLPIGTVPTDDELDLPGWYTYSRGGSAFSSTWMQTKNQWFGMLMPDNIIRTYEGYGHDVTKTAEQDPNLVLTGTWLIDTVEMNADGTLTIKARDLGRILIDQLFYEPVVPKQFYDLGWTNFSGVYERDPATKKLAVTGMDSSNTPWIGSGTVQGHKVSYAFDGDPNTYWLSIGNDRPSRRFAYEWVQCKVKKQTVSSVKVRTKKKGYTAYVSVMVNGVWQGTNTINYHEDGIGRNGGDIKYVATGNINTESYVTIKFASVKNVEAVRVTLGNLQDFGFGTYHYRGGIRDVEVHNEYSKKNTSKGGPAGSNPGYYNDYTDIVKLLCAWGGLFWPTTGRQRHSDATGTYYPIFPTTSDTSVLGKGVKGRVWGDFQQSGTSGAVPLDASSFDKKSLMECIGVIKDILGFIFWIDETGAAVWRFPNTVDYGCMVSTMSKRPGYKPGYAHPINETSVLMTLDCTIDSANVREMIFVGDGLGKIGAFAPGWNPNPTGLRRIGGWTDAGFGEGGSGLTNGKEAIAQCQLMADLISLQELFTYRTDRIRIPANPAIQIDDQVRIVEKTTAEGYRHYVKSIASSLDMGTGQWTYDLETNWLGYSPDARWVFQKSQTYQATQDYLSDQLDLRDHSDVTPRSDLAGSGS
jgi:hypothetical protein